MRTNAVAVWNYSAAVSRRDTEDVTVVHANLIFHKVDWETATVQGEEQHWTRPRVKEAIHIENWMSRVTAMILDWTWAQPAAQY